MNDLAPIQTSIYSALTTAPATYPVYDAVPQSTIAQPVRRPYIVIGEVVADPDEDLATATTDASISIHTWSGNPPPLPATTSKAETYAMLQFIRSRLDGQTVSGAWACTEDFNEVMEDPSSTAGSRLYHGVTRYRVRVG